jgi:heme-degrading monooxygenase HmoA
MILEHAVITVRPDRHQEFEVALGRAREVIASSPGFLSLRLHRGVESPDHYLLLVEWETLEDHTIGFRESDRFTEWRSHIGPFFEVPPQVDHYAPVHGLA